MSARARLTMRGACLLCASTVETYRGCAEILIRAAGEYVVGASGRAYGGQEPSQCQGGAHMTTSIRSMSLIAMLVAAAVVPVASAGASVQEPVLAGYYSAAPVDTSTGSTSLTAISHDSSPTALGPPVSSSLTAISHDSSPTVALHRDGSKAEPFVANVGPGPAPASTSGDGFDWGDAAIGGGAALLVACLGMVAAAGFSGRRSRTSQPTTA